MIKELHTDVLIIGAGASGASLSRILTKNSVPHLVLVDEETGTQLNKYHAFQDVTGYKVGSIQTVRGLGGGTALWGGGLIEFRDSDFNHELSYGSELIFSGIKKNYEKAWQFFEESRNKTQRTIFAEDCLVLKDAINLSTFIETKNTIAGKIQSWTLEEKSIRSVIVSIKGEATKIKAEKFVIACGTLGTLRLLWKFSNIFDERHLNASRTGIYTHPKCNIKFDSKQKNKSLKSKSSQYNHIYNHRILADSNGSNHALRQETRLSNRIEIAVEKFSNLPIFTSLIGLKKFVLYLYNKQDFILSAVLPKTYKLYIDTISPNFSYHYNQNSDKIILEMIPNNINVTELNKTIKSFSKANSVIGAQDITLAHSHYIGGMRVEDGNHAYYTASARSLLFDNLWINSPVLLNAKGYANPVLSLVALSYLVAEDLL